MRLIRDRCISLILGSLVALVGKVTKFYSIKLIDSNVSLASANSLIRRKF